MHDEIASAASVIIDADDYFTHARAAMYRAKQRIMLIGWDFDARIRFGKSGNARGDGPAKVGAYIYWLVERTPTLNVYLLRWDVGALTSIFRGITPLTLAKWMIHPRIHTKLDGKHPPASSHHQKLISIDDDFAFCGGIDVTGKRWDTRAHQDDDARRRFPGKTPYQPWHDASCALEGAAARRIAMLCRDRWDYANGERLDPVMDSSSAWPAALPRQFEHVPVTVAQTLPELPDRAPLHDIEVLYMTMIAQAKRMLYIESQYFCSRRIAEAIVARLAEADGPDIVIINPVTAQGWLEPIAMDSARARLFTAIKRVDPHNRLRLYHPMTAGGEAIYVHAKIMIVDDVLIRIGSSNLNNRSMRLDSECDVVIRADGSDATARQIVAIRDDLLGEHLGIAAQVVTDTITKAGSLIAAIETLRGSGKTLVPYEIPDLSTVEAWLADNEVLDPEGPGEMFEDLSERGLFRRSRKQAVLPAPPKP